MKRVLITLAIFISLNILCARAEKADTCLYVQMDLANRWIWRGVAYSEAPVIQPSIGYAGNKFNLSVWGSYPVERRAYSEIDFTFEYRLTKKLKLGLVDYFAINDSIGARHHFFDIKRETTWHMLDIYGIFKPVKKVPLSLLYSLWFWGADRNTITQKQNFSSYFETRYEKDYGNIKASAFAGMTLGKGFYAPHAAVVNMGVGLSKPITLGEIGSFPIKIEFILNPETQNAYINAIVTLE